jgi:hypothetical protein
VKLGLSVSVKLAAGTSIFPFLLLRRFSLRFGSPIAEEEGSAEDMGTLPEKDSNVFDNDEGAIIFTVTFADAWPFTRKPKAKSKIMV